MPRATRKWTARRLMVATLVSIAVAFGAAAWNQPAPSAAESVLGTPPR